MHVGKPMVQEYYDVESKGSTVINNLNNEVASARSIVQPFKSSLALLETNMIQVRNTPLDNRSFT
jgi:hypothetical protein